MNIVRFTLKDGTTKDFDGSKFTDEQISVFNKSQCAFPCKSCPFIGNDSLGYCMKKGFAVRDILKCERITKEDKMENEIVIGQIYIGNDKCYRKPFCVHGGSVYYEISSEIERFNHKSTLSTNLGDFLKYNEPYTPPMTFQRIKDEGIKVLLSEAGEKREVIGFSSKNKMVCYNEAWDLLGHWDEDQIKNWKVAK